MLFCCTGKEEYIEAFDKIISCRAVRGLSMTNRLYVLKRGWLSR